MTVLNKLMSFITDVFQGNWSKAWNSIVSTFKNIWNMIPTGVEFVINALIKMLNGLIDGVNRISKYVGIKIGHIPEVSLPRLRAGIDFVPSDDYPVALDYGEAVLTADEAEEYRKAKKESGTRSPFRSDDDSGVTRTYNQTFNVHVTVQKISDKVDIDDLAVRLSQKLAEEIREKEGVYA
jgi:hypothetical protein